MEKRGGVVLVKSDVLSFIPGIGHAISTRTGGRSSGILRSLNLSYGRGDAEQVVEHNRMMLCRMAGAPFEGLTTVHQVLGAEPLVVEHHERGNGTGVGKLRRGDALLTQYPWTPLLTQSADCVPVLLADLDGRVVGNIHASRKGALEGVVPRTVEMMWERFGVERSRIAAFIGPSIGPCCYRLTDSVVRDVALHASAGKFLTADGRLDLWSFVRSQLLAAGIRQVETAGICTCCEKDLFYSYRREGPECGRFGAIIWKEGGRSIGR